MLCTQPGQPGEPRARGLQRRQRSSWLEERQCRESLGTGAIHADKCHGVPRDLGWWCSTLGTERPREQAGFLHSLPSQQGSALRAGKAENNKDAGLRVAHRGEC